MGTDESSCLDDDDIATVLSGQLSNRNQGQAARIREHLQGCKACRELLAEHGEADDGHDVAQRWQKLKPEPSSATKVPKNLGPLRLERLLGKGGMGTVYLAYDTMAKRNVAVKFLHSDHTRAFLRFQKEAETIARLRHENVLTLYQAGEDLGIPYLVFEYIDGEPLSNRELPLPLDQVRHLAQMLCAGVAAAHAAGILHRDIKPQNILIDRQGHLKLADFGLAKLADVPEDVALTKDGAIIGTPRYMAPEVLRGRKATKQSDTYSIAAVLWELLTGNLPIGVPNEPSRRLVGRPEDRNFYQLLRRGLSPDPNQRPADGGAFLQALSNLHSQPLPTRRYVPALVLSVLVPLCIFGLTKILPGFSKRVSPPPLTPPGMVYLPGGFFTMGRSLSELEQECTALGQHCLKERMLREQPRRKIQLSPYFLDTWEVDNRHYAIWLRTNAHNLNVKPDRDTGVLRFVYNVPDRTRQEPSLQLVDLGPDQDSIQYADGHFVVRPGQEDLPLQRISWDGARRYCQDQGKRLPTEAEWEHAARRGDQRYPFGEQPPTCEGVTYGRDKGGPCPGFGPRAVGRSPQDRTELGIHDLAGNVFEWVEDAFVRPLYEPCEEARQNCKNPKVQSSLPLSEDMRIIRGGSWTAEPTLLRGSARGRWRRTDPMVGLGFRCAASVPEEPNKGG